MRILIVAAESSSTEYAIRLLKYWKISGVKIDAFGIGNEEMKSLGFQCLGRSEDLAVVGIFEVVRCFHKIKHVFNTLIDKFQTNPPQVVLLIDYPDFNFALAKKLKKINPRVPILYYIPPQMWVWRKNRIKTLKKIADKICVIFPHEVEFYKENNLEVEYVGHPLVENLDGLKLSKEERCNLRQSYGISDNEHLIGLMPGSRYSEIKNMLETQVRSALFFKKNKIAVLIAKDINDSDIKKQIKKITDRQVICIKLETAKMIQMCDTILAKSGTGTLWVALMKVPMVIVYKFNMLTASLGGIFIKRPRFFGLPNIILNKSIVRELLQKEFNIRNTVEALSQIINNDEARRAQQSAFIEIQEKLKRNDVTKTIAYHIERLAKEKR